jgi:hypothetical protein
MDTAATVNQEKVIQQGMGLYVKFLQILEKENAKFNYDERCAILMSLGRSLMFRGLRHLKEAYGNDTMLANFEELLDVFQDELKLIVEIPDKNKK